MNGKMQHDEISLKLLDNIAKEPQTTQRTLADDLGIALGLVNAYLKRLCKKGYIKITTLPRNRIKYIITPKGFAEKTKLTYTYMHYSLEYFKEARQKMEDAYKTMIENGCKTVLIWGDGELAELCYISTRGLPLSVVGIVGGQRIENGFFGHDIYSVEDVKGLSFDAVIVASIEDGILETIREHGVVPESIYSL
ncbi:MAG: winged helix-turn-helix transcriptional regulator [Nitrospirae bacterium]|nr:MAG: winged helix-turn-helix transcriptional regulator [Nitrospirota bacterium]